MGTSRPFYIPRLCNWIIDYKPESILDIGVGFGKNGFLAREYTDIWSRRYAKSSWKTKIDGIEIFEAYITDVHRDIYTSVFVGDVFDILPKLDHYDLIIATDVVEHLTRQKAVEVLKYIREKSGQYFVTIPKNVGTRGGHASEGTGFNDHEGHVSGEWSEKELKEFGNPTLLDDWIWMLNRD